MESVWLKNKPSVKFGTFNGNINTDVLIIGGGICGILCSYKLKKAGINYVLAEADEICGGVTENTTAKITLQHGAIFDKMIKDFGKDKAMLYINAQIDALKEYEKLCQNIDCDYEIKDSYVYSLNDRKMMEREAESLNKLGVKAEFLNDLELPIKVRGAVRVRNQAQFNPLKFLCHIANDLRIFEHTKILELKPYKAITDHGEITYKKLIIATHFPMLNKHGAYFLKLYQHRSYVLALKNAQNVNGMYVDKSETGLSFRNYGELLLLGGGAHRTGKKGGCWQELERFAEKHYPGSRIVAKWATQDCMSLDGIPYIGQYAKSTPDVYVATGFNKWGMTNSMAASDILCDLVQGKENQYAEVFLPSRSILRQQAAINAIESAVGLITPTTPRCPHLGCALKYNAAEHSWACPCHGSRFSKKGELIDNPATDDNKRIGKYY